MRCAEKTEILIEGNYSRAGRACQIVLANATDRFSRPVSRRIGPLNEPLGKAGPQVAQNILTTRVFHHVVAFLRIRNEVIQLVGTVRVTMDVFPLPSPYHARWPVFIESHYRVAVSEFLPAKDRGKTQTGSFTCNGVCHVHVLEKRGQKVVVAQHFVADNAGRHRTRPGDDHRNFHRRVKHVRREGRVSLPVETVVSHVHSVVAREHGQRVLPDALSLELCDYIADCAVHFGDGSVVPAQLPAAARFVEAGGRAGYLPGVHRFEGCRIEGATLVVFVVRPPWVLIRSPRAVRSGVMNAEIERAPRSLPLPQKCNGVLRNDVGHVSRFRVRGPIPDHRSIIIAAPAARVHIPEREPFLRAHGIPEVPFPAQAARIPVLRKNIRVPDHPAKVFDRPSTCHSRHFVRHISRAYPVMNTVLGRNSSGEDTGAGGRTDRRSADEIRESDTLGGKPIEVRSPDFPVACAPESPRTLVVRKENNDVRAIVSRPHGILLTVGRWVALDEE